MDSASVPDDLSPALDAVISRFAGMVRGVGWRHRLSEADVDEVMQQVRIRLWRAQRESEQISRAPASYVYRTAVSAALDLMRRRGLSGRIRHFRWTSLVRLSPQEESSRRSGLFGARSTGCASHRPDPSLTAAGGAHAPGGSSSGGNRSAPRLVRGQDPEPALSRNGRPARTSRRSLVLDGR